jgi:hypothetical protein
MLDLGFLFLLAIGSAGVGLWLLRRFGPLPDHPADALALALPLGLGAFGLAMFGLGEAGVLNAWGIGSVLAVGSVVVLWNAYGSGGWGRMPRSAAPRPPGYPILPVWPDRALAVMVGVALVGTLLTALAPVTDGDALCYHLQVSRRFLEHKSLFFDPDLHETVYPLLAEMLDTAALAVRGPVACRLVEWLLGVALVLNVTALARPSLGRRAWWAGAVTLLVPAVSSGMSAPLNDVALAAMGTAALVAWTRFRDRPSVAGAALTGVLTGLAMGVKYPALVLAGLIGLAVVLAPLTTARGRLRHVLTFALAAWLVGGCWYVRAYWHTGNPVHPFFRQTFGGAGLDEVLGPEKRPLAVTPLNLLSALGPMTLQPDRFDSLSHQFGPVFLLFLPALLLERPPRRVVAIAGMGYAFLAVCLTQRQSMRFVLTALGPLAVAVAWLAETWWQRRSVPGRLLVGLLLVALGAESALALARSRHGLAVVLGIESARHYLARREPTYTVGRWVDANLPADAWIVGQDHRGYYIPRAYTMELAHRRRTGLGKAGEPAPAIVATLRRAGFTHLLLCPPEPETAVEFDGTLSRRLAPWLLGRDPLYRADLADADGVVRHYAIYELAPRRGQPPVDPDVARTGAEGSLP